MKISRRMQRQNEIKIRHALATRGALDPSEPAAPARDESARNHPDTPGK